MAFKKGEGGRPAGVQNKFTVSAKNAFAMAFEKIGGYERLAGWAEENPTEFFKLYSKLIPTTLDADVKIKEARELTDAELAHIASLGSAGIIKSTDGEE